VEAVAEDRSRLEARIRELGPWFHNLRIRGVPTAPDHYLGDYPDFKWRRFAHVVPEDLSGATVLDIGCNAGFYALEMKRRGADRVVAIDWDPHYLRQAEFAAEQAGLAIELRRMSVYDVAALGSRFDLVVFMGVLYHLRYPMLALDLIHAHVADDLLLFQSMQRGADAVFAPDEDYAFTEQAAFGAPAFPRLHFVEHRFAGDPTNWWIPNRAGVEAMLRSAGFAIAEHPEPEVYLCRRAPRPEAVPPPPAILPR
jgi:tRNA (mo5U34)-methyltransferase